MNENSNDFKIIRDKPRSRKLNPKIDFAAMVSVSFLLIVFFMVTVELSRPNAMDLGLPNKTCTSCGGGCGIDLRRQITLLLDDDNKVISYRGLLEFPDQKPKKLAYGKDGIRKELTIAKKEILQATGDIDRGAIVIIKPSKKSNYGNLVDILDEMAITNIETYAIIDDYTLQELNLLASK